MWCIFLADASGRETVDCGLDPYYTLLNDELRHSAEKIFGP
jgi:hypothetical protein